MVLFICAVYAYLIGLVCNKLIKYKRGGTLLV